MSRGSRKHILDWTSKPEFCAELVQLVDPVDVRISASSSWMPRGHNAAKEARLETFGPAVLPDSNVWRGLRTWWLAHEQGANTPNWDIALSAEVEGKPGLVLVEAKANVPELRCSGKALQSDASGASRQNHQRIGTALDEAYTALRLFSPGVAISRDSHYQLSNRIAFAWKLATLGVPTVLVYLGFWGDQGIVDAGEPFRDPAHWNEVFASYAHSRVPSELLERRIDCGPGSAWFLVRSRPVIQSSERVFCRDSRGAGAHPRRPADAWLL
jgi:hypothetical protein